MKITNIFIALSAVTLISACDPGPTEHLQESIVETTPATNGAVNPTASFDPSNAVIPFPNNLLFAGTEDLTLNIPVADEADFSDPAVAINALDGFSTVVPFSSGFSTAIDSASLSGTSVKVYEVTLFADATTPIAGPVVAINAALTYGVDYSAALSPVDSSQSTLAIVPLQPLKPQTSYMVVITDDLKSSDGSAFGPSITYRLIKSLSDPLVFCADPASPSCTLPGSLRSLTEEELASFEGLRQIINTGEATVAGSDASIGTSDIIQSWSFTTQSVGEVLSVVRSLAGTPATSLSASTVNLGAGAGKSPAGAANMFEGTIDIPYYLTAPSQANPVANLTVPWQAANALGGENNLTNVNPLPAVTDTLTIPMLVSTPAGAPAPWKTVIFQHGVTRDRADLLAIADTLALAGFAVVAIDMPLHGLDSSSLYYKQGMERTFEVDFVTQVGETITAAVPDGVVDTTGAHFVNLSKLLVLRDNLRQSVADLFALTAAIPGLDIGDGGDGDFDSSNIYYVGHSFGSIMGTTFLAFESDVKDAVLAMSGVGLAKMMDGSSAFSPQLVGGLAANGVSKGTPDYEDFLGAAQTVIDSVDAVNYAADAADGRGILLFEVIGGDASPSDLFVPNTVPDANDVQTGTGPTVPAALAGTDVMIELMQLDQVSTSQIPGSELDIVVKFTAGDHRSFLSDDPDLLDDPDFASVEVTANIRTGMASFLATDGTGITIADDTVIEAPAP